MAGLACLAPHAHASDVHTRPRSPPPAHPPPTRTEQPHATADPPRVVEGKRRKLRSGAPDDSAALDPLAISNVLHAKPEWFQALSKGALTVIAIRADSEAAQLAQRGSRIRVACGPDHVTVLVASIELHASFSDSRAAHGHAAVPKTITGLHGAHATARMVTAFGGSQPANAGDIAQAVALRCTVVRHHTQPTHQSALALRSAHAHPAGTPASRARERSTSPPARPRHPARSA